MIRRQRLMLPLTKWTRRMRKQRRLLRLGKPRRRKMKDFRSKKKIEDERIRQTLYGLRSKTNLISLVIHIIRRRTKIRVIHRKIQLLWRLPSLKLIQKYGLRTLFKAHLSSHQLGSQMEKSWTCHTRLLSIVGRRGDLISRKKSGMNHNNKLHQ